MDWWLVFAVFLYFACAALMVAEVFVPSAGAITAFAILCLIGGVCIFFQHSQVMGWIGIAVAIIMIPSVWIFAYKTLPKTRFGKRVMLSPSERRQGDAVPDTDELKGLLGAVGTVISPLRPVGMCDFAGRRVECVAEGGYVDRAQKVKVIRVESTQLTVRIVQES
ncbi:MAG: NfeD family protein [Planctomycetota bacterium]|jgi:membrane-bound serine protease (ClpP class)